MTGRSRREPARPAPPSRVRPGTRRRLRRCPRNEALSDKEIDMALVERVQRGDKGAYDLLVLKYQHRIGHLVSRYVARCP